MKQLIPFLAFLAFFLPILPAQNGLVGYYSFCNCTATDYSGQGNHGIMIGTPDCIPGQRGDGFLFNQAPTGNNGCGLPGGEYVSLPPYGAIWANGFTVCAWVRFDDQLNYERITDFGNDSGDNGGMPIWFGREGSTNNLVLESWISNNSAVNRSTGRLVAANAITNGSIEYYCATISSDTMRIYVNGVLKAEKKGHPILNVPRIKNYIGHSNWCSNDPDFKGFMDEVRVYNRALSVAEINNLYLQTPSFAPYQSPVSVGQPVQLQAQGGVAYEWWPAATLNNPNIANPVATPLTSTTYYCKITQPDGCIFTDSLRIQVQLALCASSCTGQLGENIYPNGDFGSGIPNVVQVNPNLAPGYIYQTNPPPNDGYYSIANNTTPWGWFATNAWINIQDNGPEPNGYMMVVNASYPPGMFFENRVDVCENTLYEFSIDVINLFESHLNNAIEPNLTLMIDSVPYCETGNIKADEQWHTLRFSFTTAPGQTSVLLGMRNNAPGGYGNDLAIDNISFRACGPELLSPDTIWFCAGGSAQLSVQLQQSFFAQTAYQWQIKTNGNWEDIPGANTLIYDVPNPVAGAEYRLLVASAVPNLALPNCRVVSQEIRLAQWPEVLLQTAGTPPTCFGQSNGSAMAFAAGGLAPYTYSWASGQTGSSLAGLGAGAYALTVSDKRGCTQTASITLSEPAQIEVTTTGAEVDCFGGNNGTLNAGITGGTQPFQYQWNNGQTTAQAVSLSAGTYSVTITDANGCSITATSTINEPSALQGSTDVAAVSCFGGNNGQLSINPGGGTPPYQYQWNNGETTVQVSGLSAGVYSLTMSDAHGCTFTLSAGVPEPDAMQGSTAVVAVACAGGNNGALSAGINGGVPPYVYQWNTGQTTAQIDGLNAGVYSLTVTDANGCTFGISGNVQEPNGLQGNTDASAVSCFGGNNGAVSISAFGGTPPYQYQWNTGQTTAEMSGLNAGLYSVTMTDANGCSFTAESSVSEPSLLQGSTGAVPVACFGGNNGGVTATAEGGTAPYVYQWNTGQTAAQLDGLSAGTYSVTMTDANGCSFTASEAVQEPLALLGSTSAVDVSCFGGNNGALTADAAGGTAPYQFVWSNGQSTAQIAGLGAGTYSVTLTDAHGCTFTTTQTVQEPTALLGSTQALDVSCFDGNNGALSADASGGTEPYLFQWSNGESSAQIGAINAGTYSVTITDAHGCTFTTSQTVQQPDALQGNIGSTAVSCFGGNNGALACSINGGTPPYQYQWNNGQNSAQIGGLTAGAYGLTVSDANGCTFTLANSVQEPVLLQGSAEAAAVSCFGGNNGALQAGASGGTAPYQYHWSSGQTSAQVGGLGAGTYVVTITDTNGCTHTAAAAINQPVALTCLMDWENTDCFGGHTGEAGVVVQGGTPPYTYTWQNGQTSAAVQGLGAGWHAITITDANNCLIANGVMIEEPPLLSGQAAASPTACPEVTDGRAVAHASGGVGPYQYLWSSGQQTNAISDLSPGPYRVTMTDAHGCTATAATSVAEGQPVEIDLGLDQTLNLGEELVVQANVSLPPGQIELYQWSGAGGELSCPDCDELRFVPLESGCVRAQVRSVKGCAAEDETCFRLIPRRRIYVPNVITPESEDGNNYFTIYSDASVKEVLYLKVYSRWGEQLFQAFHFPTNYEPAGWDGSYRSEPMNPGVFVWVAEVEFIDGEVIFLKGDVTVLR